MSSKNETGHAVNVANYEKLISYVSTYPKYNPKNEKLVLAALNAQLGDAKAIMTNINAIASARTVEINKRQTLFAPIPKLATRLIAALSSSQIADRRIVKDAQTVARKLQGSRAEAKEETDSSVTEEQAPKYISVSQRSYDNQVEFIDRIIRILGEEPAYAPNEVDLTTAALKDFHKSIADANKAVVDAEAAFKNQLIVRQELLYAPITGIVDTAKEVKNYVKSIYDGNHPSFKQVNAIRFRTLKA